MKRICLIRHAKSDWAHAGLSDIDRPLNQRGYNDAYRMALLLSKKNLKPDLIISSPATRAASTAFIFARALKISENHVKIAREIYESDIEGLKNLIQKTNAQHNFIMVFGHNPTFTDFFNDVCNQQLENIPTCGVMLIDFNTADWTRVFEREGKLTSSYFPKEQRN